MAVHRPAPSDSNAPVLEVRLGVVRDGGMALEGRARLDGVQHMGPGGFGDRASGLWLEPHADGPRLRTSQLARVRLRRGQQVQAMILQDGDAALVLQSGDQLRVDVGPSCLLVHLVPAHPPARKDLETGPSAFRPLLVDRDDPVFLGLLSFFGAVALALLVVAARHPVVETVEFVEPPERILVVLRPPPDPTPVPATDRPSEVVEAEPLSRPPEPKPPEEGPIESEPEPVALAAGAQRRAERIQSLERKSAVLGSLGNLAGRLDDPAREAALDAALAAIGTGSVAVAKGGADPASLWRAPGPEGGRADASVDLEGGAPGGGGLGRVSVVSEVGEQAPRRRRPSLQLEAPADMQAGVLELVASRYKRQLEACYVRQLNAEPALSGRVVLAFDVEAGQVAFAAVTENGTGSTAFADCIERRVQHWDFAGDAEGAYVLPLVFEAG